MKTIPLPEGLPKLARGESFYEAAVPVLPEGLTYDEAVRQLEGLVAQMESGQLPLEALLGAYRQSSALLGWCRDRLQGVEDQIKRFDSPGQAG